MIYTGIGVVYAHRNVMVIIGDNKLQNMTSIKQMDQSTWVCYKYADNSYYYGQAAILDASGHTHPSTPELLADPKNKLVKHGFGIYIYDDPTGQARYQGFWDKDQKNGKGRLIMKDGGEYDGQFKEGLYHDAGVLKWGAGHVYDGRWRRGRMEGAGLFKRADGYVLKGSFKNNYYIDGSVLRNPFMSDAEYEQLKKRRKQIVKQYEKNEKIKSGFVQRIGASQLGQLPALVHKSNANNRVTLILASEQSQISFNQVKNALSSNGEAVVIDLRKAFKLQKQQKFNYIQQKCLQQGHTIILSLDDSQTVPHFDELFYPQIKQLYTSKGFNSSLWSPRDLRKPQVRGKIIGQAPVHEKFVFCVWSKVKLRQGLSEEFLREKVQKRFEAIVPYIKVDVAFVQGDAL